MNETPPVLPDPSETSGEVIPLHQPDTAPDEDLELEVEPDEAGQDITRNHPSGHQMDR